MAAEALRRSDFREMYAVHAAVRAAIKSKLYAKDAAAKKAAENLLKHLDGEKSMYGRQCRMIRLMQKGATISQLRSGLKCSRRTVFRYFLDLEKADVDITLDGTSYKVSQGLLNLVS